MRNGALQTLATSNSNRFGHNPGILFWGLFAKSDAKMRNQTRSQRCVLFVSQAREIYKFKFLASTSLSTLDAQGQHEEISNCTLLAAKYGVSSKTIRDIWNRKTWVSATDHLIDQKQVSLTERSCFECLGLQVRKLQIT